MSTPVAAAERAAWVKLCSGSVSLTIQEAHERHGGTTPPALREEAERLMREGAEELERLARGEYTQGPRECCAAQGEYTRRATGVLA